MLIQFADHQKVESGHSLRADTTVTQTNIAYPVDARLLWDSVRVLIREANEVFEMGCRCYGIGPTGSDYQLIALHEQLDHYLTLAAVAITQCEWRVLKGEKVPAEQKVVSLFEEHTDIICRGKSMSPTEFGHEVLFATGKSGLITQYQVLEGNPGDNELLPGLLVTHKRQYGKAPRMFCAYRRFFSTENEETAHTHGVKRYLWKGWRSFKKYVALGVVTFNLRKFTSLI